MTLKYRATTPVYDAEPEIAANDIIYVVCCNLI